MTVSASIQPLLVRVVRSGAEFASLADTWEDLAHGACRILMPAANSRVRGVLWRLPPRTKRE